MRRTILLTCCSAALLCAVAYAQSRTLSGCVTGEAGNLALSAVPSGEIYRLQGNLGVLNQHRNQLVRITGSESHAAGSPQQGSINVQSVQVLASTCTAMPPQAPGSARGAAGKQGSVADSVDVTTTKSAGEVTPGVQTEAGMAQQPGKHAENAPNNKSGPPARGKLAPPQWGQVGENQPAANRSAAAAERAEEEPSHTLGVNATPSYSRPGQAQGTPASQGGGIAGNAGAAAGTGMQTPNPTQGTTRETASKPPNPGGNAKHKRRHRRGSPETQAAPSGQQPATPPPQ